MTTDVDTEPAPEDSWLTRALARRAAEESDEFAIPGARFNSYI